MRAPLTALIDLVPSSDLPAPGATGWWVVAAFAASAVVAGAAWLCVVRSRRRHAALTAAIATRTAELEREVDRRRRVEVELQTAHRALEERIVQIEADARAREALQRQVDQLQRMESVGKLAGGIAHDFNNLLTVVLGSCELLQGPSLVDAHRRELLTSIADAGRRGRALTQQLLTFAQNQAVASEVLDLNELVSGATRMLQRLLPDNIRLELHAVREPVLVMADRAQLEQVLVNLSVNARDAMPDGGVLRIELTASMDEAPHTCTLRVVDDGIGMPPDVRDHACEPFFSTKHRATNSGLGLSTCYGIVKGLGGALTIESEVGVGTSVAVVLPCADQGAVAADRGAELPRPRRLSGTLLLIEDDDAVRAALQRTLIARGCEVVAASNGDHAVALLDDGRHVDFVLSDLIMPGLQGTELVDALRSRRPGVPIVFLSGYNDVASGAQRLRALGIEVLRKPPDGQQLIAAIERARAPAAHAGIGAGARL